MKIDLEEVESLLLQKKVVEPAKVQEIIRDLTKIAEENKEANASEKEPKSKWEHVIILEDKEGILAGKEIAGYVVQQQDGQDAGLVLSKIHDAAVAQNDSAKKKKFLITNFSEAFSGLKTKNLKEKGIRIKTKHLTRVLVTDGNFRVGAPAAQSND
jgi:hypothetical protein